MIFGRFKKNLKQRARIADGQRGVSRGVTIVEMAVAMMVLVVLGVAMSGLVRSGVETQMSQRTSQTLQSIGMSIVEDLRKDIRRADTAQVQGGGNVLALTISGTPITYSLTAAGAFTRKAGAEPTKVYNDPNLYTSFTQVQCDQGCFRNGALNSNAQPTQILLPSLRVVKVLPNGSQGSIIDRNFGGPSYLVSQFAFDVFSSTEFQ